MDAMHELIARIDRQIAEEEAKMRQRIDRINHAGGALAEDEVNEAWGRFNLAVEPMRRQREYIIEQLATIEAAKAPAPIIIPSPHSPS